jgi:hypothetical protein
VKAECRSTELVRRPRSTNMFASGHSLDLPPPTCLRRPGGLLSTERVPRPSRSASGYRAPSTPTSAAFGRPRDWITTRSPPNATALMRLDSRAFASPIETTFATLVAPHGQFGPFSLFQTSSTPKLTSPGGRPQPSEAIHARAAVIAARGQPTATRATSSTPAAMSATPARRPTRSPRGTTFSTRTATAMTATQRRFMTPATNRSAMSAQQQARQ